MAATGWKRKSISDYFSKQLRAYIRRMPKALIRSGNRVLTPSAAAANNA